MHATNQILASPLLFILIEIAFLYWLAVSASSKYGQFLCALYYGGLQIASAMLSGGKSAYAVMAISTVFVFGMLKLLDRLGSGVLWRLAFIGMCAGALGIKMFVRI